MEGDELETSRAISASGIHDGTMSCSKMEGEELRTACAISAGGIYDGTMSIGKMKTDAHEGEGDIPGQELVEQDPPRPPQHDQAGYGPPGAGAA